MKTLLLLLLASGLTLGSAAAQTKVKTKYRAPKAEKGTAAMTKPTVIKRKKTFSHTTEAGAAKGDANHAQFRRPNRKPTLNLHPHDPTRFTKARANKNYKFPNPHK